MGLFSGGNSKSSTTVYNTTQNAGFSEIGGNALALQGDGNTVKVLDGGAIKRAFEFATDSLSFSEQSNKRASDIVQQVSSTAGRQTQEAVQAISESARTGAENIARQAGTIAVLGLIAWAGVKLIRG